MQEQSLMMNAQEVAAALSVSIPKAYKVIHQLNKELQELGKLTVSGKINRRYFEKKMEV